ncbi:MAG: hypothetical protein ACYTG0_41145 [Planctomycetota bacterium]
MEKAIFTVGQITGDLFHPTLVRIRRATGKVNTTSGHFHDEEQIVRDQSSPAPDFNGCEVDRRQHLPMRPDEGPPRGLPFPFRSRFDAMVSEDIANSLIGDLVTKVRQGALDPVISPAHIFARQANNKIDNLLPYTWASHGCATFAVIPLSRNQHTVPPEDRIRREECADFAEELAAKNLSLDSQTAPLIVVQQDAFLTEFLFEHLILGPQVLDDFLLLTIDPTSENDEIQLPGLKNEIHGLAISGTEICGSSLCLQVLRRSTDSTAANPEC